MTRPATVFLARASRDLPRLRPALAELDALEAAGVVKVIVIPYRPDWWSAAQHEIDTCNLFVFFLSWNSLASRWCLAELNRGLRKAPNVVVVGVEEFTFSTQLRARLQRAHLVGLADFGAHLRASLATSPLGEPSL